ncbi:Hsp20/alpha crystallin family protein [Lederbergia wuyishanensis]|uniref:HSP20 family molecular chaperone IbpA n=1 Tax=Lederbergia wuyishanensis TaxID=1347903 RepID=A0ABU0D0U1_9BACI|nr:Hsp20/alpha crystallin family protein [Lederbergia wuyishanensis]MCJ8006640.1 Hsp20/alpha crystallin family protein [Lederbergia wuyishanensis]MDQ0342021.1 HSP20 family molecular chaperone IbpA [Lederbergia wuyishanensis]
MAENRPSKKEENPLFEPFTQLMNNMNRLFSERPDKNFLQNMDDFFFHTKPFGGFVVELKENDKEYIVQAQLPGTKKEQINIEILPQYITITVNHQESITKEDTENTIIQKKESWRQSSRTIPFSKPIDQGNVKAVHEDGVLTVTIPKRKGRKVNIG